MDWQTDFDDSESIAGDRRSDRRYRIQLDLRWKLIHRRKVQETGSGQTIDLSSGGVLFESPKALPVGLNVELSIAWPVLLHNTAAMQLVILGRIVRSEGTRVGLRITQHEFRTLAMPQENRNAGARNPGGLSAFSGGKQSAFNVVPPFRTKTWAG